MTTHDLGDIERLCRRIILINHGKISYDGALEALRRELGLPTVLTVEFAGQVPFDISSLFAGRAEFSATGATTAEVRFDRCSLTAGAVVNALNDLGEIRDIHLREPAIEEIIRRLYG